MNNNFLNLVKTVNLFDINSGLDNEQVLYFFNKNIELGLVKIEDLKIEFQIALKEVSFNWINFASSCNILINPESYSDIEIKNYVKGLIWDLLFPDKRLSNLEIKLLCITTTDILRKYNKNEGWLFSYDLYKILQEQVEWKNLEYYQLWNINLGSNKIERKLENADKDMEIGYLRYKG